MENDGSVDSLADGLSIGQLELPLVSEHAGIDERRRLGAFAPRVDPGVAWQALRSLRG